MEEELAYAIEIVADQLGITVEYIYGTFVAAQPVIGAMTIVSVVAVILATAISTRLAYKSLRSYLTDDKGNWDNDESPMVAFFGSVIAAVLFAIVFFALADDIRDALLRIFCPEYTAIREILSLVMGG